MAITINVNLDEILQALKDDLDFTGNANKYIKVNATADGFEFAAVSTSVSWGEILGLLSDQTDLQNAFDLKANLSGAAFTGGVSVTTSGSGTTLGLTNSGSGTTLNIANSGSGDFLVIDTDKLVVSNNGNLAIDTDTLFVDSVNNRVGVGTATPSYPLHVERDFTGGASNLLAYFGYTHPSYQDSSIQISQYYNALSVSFAGLYSAGINLNGGLFGIGTQNVGSIKLAGGRGTEITNLLSPTTVGSVLKVTCATTDSVGQIIQAAAGQTANLQEWRGSVGNVMSKISSTGDLYAPRVYSNTFRDLTYGNNWVLYSTVSASTAYLSIGNGAVSQFTNYVKNGGYFEVLSGANTMRYTNGSLGIGTSSPSASAILQADSTTKGFLPPVMTGAQVEAISSPAEGLMAYATSAGTGDVTAAGWWGYNGSNWVSL